MSGDIIQELVSLFSFEVDDDSYKKAQKSYTDLRFLAVDLVNIFERVGSTLLKPLEAIVEAGTRAVRMSAVLGASVTGFQELQAAVGVLGVDSGVLTTALTRLQRSAYEATHGNKKLAESFGAMKVDVRDGNHHLKKADDLFEDIIKRLAKMPDEATRTALAFKVMGRGVTPLLPLIAGGAEQLERLLEAARNSGVVLDEKTARAAEHLSVSTKILGMDLNGLIMKIGGGLIPIAQKLTDTVTKWFVANRKLIDSKIDEFVGKIAWGVEKLFKRMLELWQVANAVAEAFGGWKNVLEIVAGIVGFTLLVAVGKLTVGMLTLTDNIGTLLVRLATGAVVPALFGAALLALLGITFLVIQDLKSVNSRLLKLVNMGVEPGTTKLDRLLISWRNMAYSVADAFGYLQSVGGRFFGTEAQRNDSVAEGRAIREGKTKKEVLKEMEGEKKEEQGWWNSFMGKDKGERHNGLGDTAGADAAARRAAVERWWSVGQAGGQATLDAAANPTIEVHQTFNGPADPGAVRTATTAGITEAAKKLNFRVKYR